MKYDVVVAGAGPAGCSAAEYLAGRGFSTLVLEKNNGYKPKSIFTLTDFLRQSGLEHVAVGRATRYVSLTTTGKKFWYEVDDEKHGGCVIDEAALVRKMRARAMSMGAEIRFGTEARRVVEKDSEVEVRTNGDVINCKYLIDASGGLSNVARMIGFVDDNPWAWVIYGKKFHGNFDERTAVTIKGENIGKASWLVPRSRHEADITAADIRRLYDGDPEINKKFNNMTRLVEALGIAEIGHPTDVTYEGCIRIEPVKRAATKRIFLIGDAAGQGSPLTGDALRPAIVCGRMLGELIAENKTHEYESIWRRSFNYRIGKAIRNILLSGFGDIDRILDFENIMAGQLSEQELYQLVASHEISARAILRIARNPRTWPFLARLAFEYARC